MRMENNIDTKQGVTKKIVLLLCSDYIVSVLSTGIHAVLVFAYGIFVRHYVLPIEYGAYTTANIVLTYLNFLHLGVLNSYNRDYPQAVGASNCEKMSALENTTVTYIGIIYLIIGIIVSVIAQILVMFGRINDRIANGVCLLCVSALLSNLSNIGATKCKAKGLFFDAARIHVISTLVQVIIGGAFVFAIGYYGIYIALILCSLSSIIQMRTHFKTVRLSIEFPLLRTLIITGIPLLVNGLIWTLIMTSDQFIILYFSGSEQLGLYSVAQTIFSIMILIPQAVSQVMYIKLSNYYGMTTNKAGLLKITEKYLFVISIINCAIMMVVYTIIPLFTKVFMPAYLEGVSAARILCIGVAIYGGTMVYGNLFTILKKNKQLFKATICLCIANIFFSCALVMVFGFKLELVAYGTAASYSIYSLILIFNTSKMFTKSLAVLIVDSYWIITLFIILTIVVNAFVGNTIIRYLIIGVFLFFLMCICIFSVKKGLFSVKSSDTKQPE